MPYIKREEYARAARLPITSGELNYAITLKIIEHLTLGSSLLGFYGSVLKICISYLNRRGLTYTIGNEIQGVLTCAGKEALRRCGSPLAVNRVTEMLAGVGDHIYDNFLAPYEDDKIKENGDVYPKALVV